MLCIKAFPCSGGRTRTYDLRVMSPTSYQLLHPAMWTSKVQKLCISVGNHIRWGKYLLNYLQASEGQADI